MSCVACCRARLVKVAADGKSVVFRNEAESEFHLIQVDGCIVRHRRACDRIVVLPGIGALFIEFKGADVKGAAAQLEASLVDKSIQMPNVPIPVRGALVVCTRVPRFQARDASFRLRFKRQHGVALKFLKPGLQTDFAELLK